MKQFGLTLIIAFNAGLLCAQYSIVGTVKSNDGTLLSGASLRILGSNLGVVTDDQGKFMMDIPPGKYVLRASYLGYAHSAKSLTVDRDMVVDFVLIERVFQGEEILVTATRVLESTPSTYTELDKEEIRNRNFGQDMPYVLQFTPSSVATSDAGAAVGYTGMRIRGSDATRINVTVNGIPINDSESHGVFWVNMPDFASSVHSIQVQRGVGTSTNGAAAFGASINLQSNLPSVEAFGELNNTIGSFGTRKHTAIFNSGLIKDRWSFEGRLSQIMSDGFIDRSNADLRSYYLAAGYYGKNTTIKAITFAGKEVTQQAWYGSPEAKLFGQGAGNLTELGFSSGNALQDLIDWGGEYETEDQIENLYNSDARTFNYYIYDNEVDNYQQDHYQLHLNHQLNKNLNINLAGHYTYGRGYFEQFRNEDAFSDYGIENLIIGGETISTTDLIRRRWLDNHFYGFTYAANYQKRKLNQIIGGGYNDYDGDHFGEIIWARFAGENSNIRDRFYDSYGRKKDFNIYSKSNYQLTNKLNVFIDLQYRYIDYASLGSDNDRRPIDVQESYNFFNPKIGINYDLSNKASLYGLFAIGNREPVRSDFIDAPNGQIPEHETLRNLELGYRLKTSNAAFSANYFLMDYKNQLVLTGALNDVGAGIRENVDNSYRMGIELVGAWQISNKLAWESNVSLSQNRIRDFTEIVYNYGADFGGFEVVEGQFEDSDIAFSPNVIAASGINFQPVSGLAIQLLSKYVGDQFLDNTGNENRKLDAYFTNDIRVAYTFSIKSVERIELSVLVNNIFDVEYESNGYTWGYMAGNVLYQQNNYYPQAGINFLTSLALRF